CASLFPFIIITFATLQFFSFQTNKAYNIFLTTLPITRKKQLTLSFITLFSLSILFSIIVFFITILFQFHNSLLINFTFNQSFNMCIVYFLTLLLFTAIILFLKILFVHERTFFITLFFLIISIIMATNMTFVAPAKTFSIFSLLPIPFNLIQDNPLSFPHLGTLRLTVLFLGTIIFTLLAYILHEYQYRTHQSRNIQKIAAIVIYSLILTPIFYTLYQYAQISITFTFLILIIICIIIILKLSFKKIVLWTLVIPFIVSNCISIPLTLAKPMLIQQQLIQEWKQTNFSSRNKIEVYLPDINIFNKNRTIQISFDSIPQQKMVLAQLAQLATLQPSDNTVYSGILYTPLPQNYLLVLRDNNVYSKTFSIQWKSDTEKKQFGNLIENLITELESLPKDKGAHTVTSSLVNYKENDVWFLSNELKPVAKKDDKSLLTPPSTKQIIEAVDILQSTETRKFEAHTEFYASLFNITNFPNANINIIISN
ncbi:MAG: hypothetical protein ACRCV7_00570, partial [Culicoidibacterales bacterium]